MIPKFPSLYQNKTFKEDKKTADEFIPPPPPPIIEQQQTKYTTCISSPPFFKTQSFNQFQQPEISIEQHQSMNPLTLTQPQLFNQNCQLTNFNQQTPQLYYSNQNYQETPMNFSHELSYLDQIQNQQMHQAIHLLQENNIYHPIQSNFIATQRVPVQSNYSNSSYQPIIQKNNRSQTVIKRKKIVSTKVQNPQEVERWIQARKKNYPTKQNILRKQKLKEKGISIGAESGKSLSKLELKLRKKLTFIVSELQKEDFKLKLARVKGKSNNRQLHNHAKREIQEPSTTQCQQKDQQNFEDSKTTPKQDQIQEKLEPLNPQIRSPQPRKQKLKRKQKLNTKNNIQGINMPKIKKQMLYSRLIEPEKRKQASILLQCFRYLIINKLI